MKTVLFRFDDIVAHNYGDVVVLWQEDRHDRFSGQCIRVKPKKLLKRLKKLCRKSK